jgi:hypothetical protein
MGALAFWKAVVEDRSNFLERVIDMLGEHGIRYCVIGGVAVNAYAHPIVTEDLDIIVAVDQLAEARTLFEAEFKVREFPHSLNVYDPGSKLQVQVQLDAGLTDVTDRSEPRDVMGLSIPVAAPRDLLRLKIAAALEPTRRGSKRQKDLADLVRLVEAFPELRSDIPAELAERMFL